MKRYEYHDVNKRGTIERIRYTAKNGEGSPVEKYANVYLPYGYDESKQYNVLYMMHGGGGNPDAWLDSCRIKNMLDHTIESGEVEPLLVVFPSFYDGDVVRTGRIDAEGENKRVRAFADELTEHLLPAVESRYHTFAEDTSDGSLRSARRHRGFGGFSMGSSATWYVFLLKTGYFAEFLPLSGDCWCIEPMGGRTWTVETADVICNAVSDKMPWHLRCATGTEDIAYTAMDPLIAELKSRKDTFEFSDTFSGGNLNYFAEEGNTHCYDAVMDYLYNYLPYLFR